jgi:hypothetical protein
MFNQSLATGVPPYTINSVSAQDPFPKINALR